MDVVSQFRQQIVLLALSIILVTIIYPSYLSAQQKQLPSLKYAYQMAESHNFNAAINTITAFPDNAFKDDVVLLLADYYYYADLQSQGQTFFADKLTAQSVNSSFYLGLARLSQLQEEWSEAYDFCIKGFDAGGTFPELINILIEAGLQQNQSSQLAKSLRALQKIPAQKALHDLGYAIWRLKINNLTRARESIQQYLKIKPKEPYGHLVAGNIHKALGDIEASTTHYEDALNNLPTKTRRGRVAILTNLSGNAIASEEMAKAKHYLMEALKTADNIGAIQQWLTTAETALFWLKEARLIGMVDSISERGVLLSGLVRDENRRADWRLEYGVNKRSLNQRTQALAQFNLVLKQQGATDRHWAIAQRQLATIHKAQNRFQDAVADLTRSIEHAKKAENEREEHLSLFELADAENKLGRHQSARSNYEKVLRYAQSIQDHDLIDLCWTHISQIYYLLEDIEKADYFLRMADALARQTSQLQFSANHRWLQGRTAALAGDIEKAETYFLSAIEIGEQSGAYLAILAGQACLTSLYSQSGFTELSSDYAKAALKTLASTYQLTRFDLNSQLFDIEAELFEPAISAFSQIGDLEAIYHTAELKKVFNQYCDISPTRHLLHETDIDSLNIRFTKMQWQIMMRWRKLRQRWKKDSRDQLEDLINTKNEIAELTQSREAFLDNLAEAYPKYLDFFVPRTHSLSALHQTLNSLDATYISYFVGTNTTFIVVVTPETIRCKRVNLTKDFLYSLISQVYPPVTNPDDLVFPSEENNAFNINMTGQVYQYVIDPIRTWLNTGSTLIISPDGILNHIPFEILVENPLELTDDFDYRTARYFIESYSMSYLPHASYIDGDVRMSTARTTGMLLSLACLPDGNSRSDRNQLNNLREHVERIQTAVGGEFSQSYVGTDAKQTVFANDAPKYQLIHLVLPTIIDADSPANLRISFADSTSNPFHLKSLYSMALHTPLLVYETLSGNNSDKLNIKSSNAVLHAIKVAGVRNIVTNLWQRPEDQPTVLLSDFFVNLESRTKVAEALQQSKVKYLQEGNRNPYYWADILLYGPPVDIILKPKSYWTLFSLTAVGLMFLGWLVYFKSKQLRQESQ